MREVSKLYMKHFRFTKTSDKIRHFSKASHTRADRSEYIVQALRNSSRCVAAVDGTDPKNTNKNQFFFRFEAEFYQFSAACENDENNLQNHKNNQQPLPVNTELECWLGVEPGENH